MRRVLCVFAGMWMVSSAQGAIRITEWMYNGLAPVTSIGEFIEITNVGGPAVDMTGWSFDDASRTAGSESLTGLGVLQPGESAIFTDDTAANFRLNWNLPGSVKVLGGNMNNLGRSDEVNIYNASNGLVDRLTYNDQGVGNVAGPRTNGVSGWTGPANLATNNASLWVLSSVNDAQHSYLSLLNEIGNPGTYVPEPATMALLGAGALLLRNRSRRCS